ncbi:MAG: DUF4912 domain-containing protein [Pirellulales bacterium]
MTNAAKLRARTAKDLARMAKGKQVPGWHAMRKEELVKALLKVARSERAKRNGRKERAAGGGPGGKSAKSVSKGKAPPKRTQTVEKKLERVRSKLARSKDLARRSEEQANGKPKDRLVVMVRDPYWLHAYWELTRRSIERAKAAMGYDWHAAGPVLRVFQVTRDGTTSSAKTVLRDIPIHGGVNNWYIDVDDPPRGFQLEIGYKSAEKFFPLVRSNTVTTPRPGSGEAFDRNWSEVAKDFDRVYAMSGGYQDSEASGELQEVFEQQLRRPMGNPMETQFGLGAAASRGGSRGDFPLAVDTELIVHGKTERGAHVTLKGEPVHVRDDGSFAVRFSLPDRRHVLPVVASSRDGGEQRTVVLAVDRNTKTMEPVLREPGQ